MNRTAVIYALLSAALFGVSTPAAKLLVGSIHPVTLAGLLYCGAGIGVAVLRRFLPSIVTGAPEITVSRSELPWLAGAIGAGGVLGPLLLMFGLARTNAVTASLLLTLEGAATALMAWFIFHENFDRRISIGMFGSLWHYLFRGPGSPSPPSRRATLRRPSADGGDLETSQLDTRCSRTRNKPLRPVAASPRRAKTSFGAVASC
jgi:hypothetical protein